MTEFKTFDIHEVPLQGRQLIEAAAGTGKTYAISNIFLRLILEEGLSVSEILVVTFTEAATAELRDRIRSVLRDAFESLNSASECKDKTIAKILESCPDAEGILKKALSEFDRAGIFTIHGFCARMLKENSFETSSLYDVELVKDQAKLISAIADDFCRIHFSDILSATVSQAGDINKVSLVSLAENRLRRPLARYIPDRVENPLSEFKEMLDSIADCWKSDGDAVISIIEGNMIEKKGPFSKKNRNAGFNTLSLFAENSFFSIETVKAIKNFSYSSISGKLNKSAGGITPEHKFFSLCEDYLALDKNYLLFLKQEFCCFLDSELNKRAADENIRRYDDLLLDIEKALKGQQGKALEEAVRKKFKAALIDEFQDTDPLQYDIFTRLFGADGSTLFLIGDPKQAIYSFRGADIFSYMDAVRSTPDENRYTQDTNWRSAKTLVDAVNCVFESMEAPFLFREIQFASVKSAEESKGNSAPLFIDGKQDDKPFQIWNFDDKKDKTKSANAIFPVLVEEIVKLLGGKTMLGDRKLSPGDIAVLVMTHADAEALKNLLAERNVPAVQGKTGNIFKSSEAEELERVLSAIASPANRKLLNGALAGEFIGLNANDIFAMNEDEDKANEYETHLGRFREYNDIWGRFGFMRMFRKFLSDYKVRQRLLSMTQGNRKLTNLLHLAELTHKESTERKLGINGVLTWLFENRNELGIDAEESELRLESDEEAVQILTVYKSKGLEYPVVFCPFMWQKDTKPKGNIVFHEEGETLVDLGSENLEENTEHAEDENLSELMRLLYVALTRARNRCYFAHAGLKETSSAYLRENSSLLSADAEIPPEMDMRRPQENDGQKTLYIPEALGKKLLKPREFGGRYFLDDWKIASYSMLTSGQHKSRDILHELSEYDEAPDLLSLPESVDKAPEGFFAFPKGALPGTCIHDIFEKLHFTKTDYSKLQRYVAGVLRKYGFIGEEELSDSENERVSSVCEMVENVKKAPLLPPEEGTLRLNMIGTDYCLPEMEFHFPMDRIDPARLTELFLRHSASMRDTAFHEKTAKLRFSSLKGFMHGFIDLVFESDGKYYIVDWKTNHLGNSYSDYLPEKLLVSMSDSYYILQYHIYTVALHKFLKLKLPNYSYQENFGGVFYLYLRGVNPEMQGSGIYYECPDEALIEDLTSLLSPEKRRGNKNA